MSDFEKAMKELLQEMEGIVPCTIDSELLELARRALEIQPPVDAKKWAQELLDSVGQMEEK